MTADGSLRVLSVRRTNPLAQFASVSSADDDDDASNAGDDGNDDAGSNGANGIDDDQLGDPGTTSSVDAISKQVLKSNTDSSGTSGTSTGGGKGNHGNASVSTRKLETGKGEMHQHHLPSPPSLDFGPAPPFAPGRLRETEREVPVDTWLSLKRRSVLACTVAVLPCGIGVLHSTRAADDAYIMYRHLTLHYCRFTRTSLAHCTLHTARDMPHRC